jgi:nitrate reductase NapAB chaperone NapD
MDGVIKFSDIIKKKFLEDVATGNLTLTRVVIALVITFGVAMFIQYIYKKTFSGVIYSRSFGHSLILVSLVTALIILPITSNLTLSLGMVGALSIVRFRTAVKEAYDTGFMFWAIAIGITVGAGFYLPAIVGSALIGILMIILNTSKQSGPSSYLLIIHHTPEASEKVTEVFSSLPQHKLNSRSASKSGIELILDLRLKDSNTSFMSDLLNIDGVLDASLVSHQGELLQ